MLPRVAWPVQMLGEAEAELTGSRTVDAATIAVATGSK